MSVEVFDSFDASISIAKQIDTTSDFDITSQNNITIDNVGNEKRYPKVIFNVNKSTILEKDFLDNKVSFIDSNGNKISKSLSTGDTLILDFKEQIYTLNGTNIVSDLNIDELIELNKNQENTFNINLTGDVDVSFEYKDYETNQNLHYVEDWSLTTDQSFDDKEVINSTKVQGSQKTDVSYSFDISKMETSWGFYNGIANGDNYRITYTEQNSETGNIETKYLVGVDFESYDKSFSMGDFIISDINGKCRNILTK